MDSRFYQHSGKTQLARLPMMSLFLIFSALIAFVYAYAVVYIPLVGYVNFILTGGFAAGVGLLAILCLKALRIRNNGVAAIMGTVYSLLSLYLSWVCFEFALLNQYGAGLNWFDMLLNPGAVWGTMVEIGNSGWFSIKSFTPSGGILFAMWGIEALVIVGVGVYLSYSNIKESVFCEDCGQWADDSVAFDFSSENEDTLVQNLKEQKEEVVSIIQFPQPDNAQIFNVELKECKGCDLSTLTLKKVTLKVDSEGKEDRDEEEVFQNLLLDVNFRDLLKSLPEKLSAQAEAMLKELQGTDKEEEVKTAEAEGVKPEGAEP
jgi:hypothetical protein